MSKPHEHGLVVAEFNPECENCQRRKIIQQIWEATLERCSHADRGVCIPCLLEAIKAAYDRRDLS